MNAFFRGTWASVMATSSMTMAMFKIHDDLPESEQAPLPPALLTKSVQRKAGILPTASSETQQELTMLSHYGYGAAGGVIYALLADKSKSHPVLKGSLFGLAVWAGSYYGLIPGLDLKPAGTQITPKRNLMMLASHIVWGATLGFAEHNLRNKGRTLLDGKANPERQS